MANVGYATLTVVPSFRGAQSALQRGMTGPAGAAGTAAGGMFGRNVASGAAGPIRSGFSSLMRGVGGLVAGIGAARFISGAVAEAEEAIAVGRQTEAVLASTGAAAWTSVAQVESLSSALSRKAGVDDEVIQSGQNVLLTFTNVQNAVGEGNDIFNRATTAALDMSAALGQDMQSSTIQLGKALQDPIKGVTALQRVGVSFTQQQRDQIKAMVESGDTLGAQRLIMAEVERQFAGSAEANATASMKMQTAWANIQETAGMVLLPAVNALAGGLGMVAGWFENLSPSGQKLASVLGLVGVAALAMWAALGGPATLVIGAVAAIAAGAYLLYTRFEPVRAVVDSVWQSAQRLWASFVEFLPRVVDLAQQAGDWFKMLYYRVRAVVSSVDWSGIVNGVLGLWESVKGLADALGPVLPVALAIGGALLLAFAAPVVAVLALVAGIIWAYNEFEGFRNVVNAVFSWWAGTFAPFMLDFWTSVVNGITTVVTKIREWWNASEPVRLALQQIAGITLQGLVAAVTWVIGLVRQWWALSGPVRSLWLAIAGISLSVIRTAVSAVIALAQVWWQRTSPIRTAWLAIANIALGSLRNALSVVIGHVRTLWERTTPVRWALLTIGRITLGALADSVNRVRSAFQTIADVLNTIRDRINSLPSPSSVLSSLPGLARGGFLAPGQLALVGERGPEIVSGGRYGMAVTSTSQTRRLLSSAAGFASPSDGTGPLDERALAGAVGAAVGRELDRRLARLGPDDVYVMASAGGRRREKGSRYPRS